MIRPRARAFALLIVSFFALLSSSADRSQAGNGNEEKTKIAVERTKEATEVLKKVAALPESKGIPKDIAEKMNVIGVIPDAFQLSLLFARGVRGHGLTSVRREDGWSLPSYFFFGRSTGFDFSKVGSKRFDLILVIVNAATEPPKKDDKTVPKPDDKKNDKDKPQAYLYAFADGTLKPIAIKTSFFSALLGAQTNIVFDKPLNKAIYGAKGDDILLGKIDAAKQLPPEVTAFREELNGAFSTKH